MPHLRSHTRPSPCNLPRWDRPPVDRRPALLRKLPSFLACPLNPSQSLRSAGTSKEKPPPATTSSSKTEGSSPTWGSKSCPIAAQMCALGQLCFRRASATLKGCLTWAGGKTLLRAANAPQEDFHPQSGPNFKVSLRAQSRGSLYTRLPIQSWAPLGQSRQFLPLTP